MTWDELAIDMIKAAKAMLDTHPRSSASRAYYAAHIALAKALQARGFVPDRGYSTQQHKRQSKLIGQHLGSLGKQGVKELRQAISRLYARRIDSDYVRRVTIDRQIALESLRDASAVLVVLGVSEAA
jgi:uncharacterized protein (UPF0332 family)